MECPVSKARVTGKGVSKNQKPYVVVEVSRPDGFSDSQVIMLSDKGTLKLDDVKPGSLLGGSIAFTGVAFERALHIEGEAGKGKV